MQQQKTKWMKIKYIVIGISTLLLPLVIKTPINQQQKIRLFLQLSGVCDHDITICQS